MKDKNLLDKQKHNIEKTIYISDYLNDFVALSMKYELQKMENHTNDESLKFAIFLGKAQKDLQLYLYEGGKAMQEVLCNIEKKTFEMSEKLIHDTKELNKEELQVFLTDAIQSYQLYFNTLDIDCSGLDV